MLKTVNLNIIMFRDRRRGIRRIFQVAEFEAERDNAKANILYRWSAESDTMMRHSESSRFFEDIERMTGMSESEVYKALEEKKKILSWLIKNNLRSLNEFGKTMNLFYRNKELLMSAIAKNDVKSITT